ncbi:hypothetical protein F4781DRAFT_24379 [Annulohypoxylon bovei var. microspora]|nr:hypothetical protein F4781DRAFT_24379 [Annulohypoxylon bovei var. microspora]
MAPSYCHQEFTLDEAIEAAGPAPNAGMYGFSQSHFGEPPAQFFQIIDPQLSHAFFSTNNGERPFRNVDDPVDVRPMDYWDATKIQGFADELRHKFFDRCRYIQPLGTYGYDGLYIYFDAHDIYHLGAQNLWSVIHHMHCENQYISFESIDPTIPWIHSCLQKSLLREDVRTKLRDWDPQVTNDIMSVFVNGELGLLHGLPHTYDDSFRAILMTCWMDLRRGRPIATQYQINSKYCSHSLPITPITLHLLTYKK